MPDGQGKARADSQCGARNMTATRLDDAAEDQGHDAQRQGGCGPPGAALSPSQHDSERGEQHGGQGECPLGLVTEERAEAQDGDDPRKERRRQAMHRARGACERAETIDGR